MGYTAQWFALTGASVDSVLEQKNLKAKSLSKYDLCTLNPFPDLNFAFGDIVPEV